jgi:hypothetical protein
MSLADGVIQTELTDSGMTTRYAARGGIEPRACIPRTPADWCGGILLIQEPPHEAADSGVVLADAAYGINTEFREGLT